MLTAAGILDRVKRKIGVTSNENDERILIMIEDAISAAQDYCWRKNLPNDAAWIICGVVAHMWNIAEDGGIVASVKRGDTAITYADGGGDSVGLLNISEQNALNVYRRIKAM